MASLNDSHFLSSILIETGISLIRSPFSVPEHGDGTSDAGQIELNAQMD